jgi:hypothetical protein
MAYMSQENKKEKAPFIKAVLKKYKLKGSLSIRHHSTLVLNITSGQIDFMTNYFNISDTIQTQRNDIQVNEYHINNNFSGNAKSCLTELKDIMMLGNHDNSDAMTDYFDVGWYIDINIGKCDKPYILTN